MSISAALVLNYEVHILSFFFSFLFFFCRALAIWSDLWRQIPPLEGIRWKLRVLRETRRYSSMKTEAFTLPRCEVDSSKSYEMLLRRVTREEHCRSDESVNVPQQDISFMISEISTHGTETSKVHNGPWGGEVVPRRQQQFFPKVLSASYCSNKNKMSISITPSHHEPEHSCWLWTFTLLFSHSVRVVRVYAPTGFTHLRMPKWAPSHYTYVASRGRKEGLFRFPSRMESNAIGPSLFRIRQSLCKVCIKRDPHCRCQVIKIGYTVP